MFLVEYFVAGIMLFEMLIWPLLCMAHCRQPVRGSGMPQHLKVQHTIG